MNLMFQPQFEPLIVSGRKIYASPQREFMRAQVDKVETIVIDFHNCVYVGGVALTLVEQNRLAWHDGFETCADLLCWFINNHGLPFRGELIHWKANVPQT